MRCSLVSSFDEGSDIDIGVDGCSPFISQFLMMQRATRKPNLPMQHYLPRFPIYLLPAFSTTNFSFLKKTNPPPNRWHCRCHSWYLAGSRPPLSRFFRCNTSKKNFAEFPLSLAFVSHRPAHFWYPPPQSSSLPSLWIERQSQG